ncbi:MAG: buk [Oscillospiraceae bacterium]|nr:buk [Oscillospiraceae bacterium]
MSNYKILAINPGSTSTKIAVFEGETEIFKKTVVHDAAELAKYTTVADQLPYRVETILAVCKEQGVDISDCAAFVGRGGGLDACPGGTYAVNDVMLAHARRGGGNHPASLGCQIAQKFAEQYGVKAFIVNPPDVDEFQDVARVTGLADVFRTPSSHALNQKETAIRVAADLGKTYETSNFIVAHIGGGVSVTAHCLGKMIDSNGIINGEGPMAPTRSGALPAVDLMNLCYSGKWTRDEMYKRLTKSGGFVDHVGTSETLEVVDMIKQGNKYAKLVYDTFQYQIAKEIGSMAAVLKGKVDAIILTGGIAHDKELCANMKEYVGFIAPIEVRAGEFEMEALSSGAYRVLTGHEEAKPYTGEKVFTNFDALKN